MVDEEDHEEAAAAAVEQPVSAPEATVAPADTLDSVFERWLGVEISGTVYADTPEKWNEIRQKIDNLKNLVKSSIKE